jgi:DNA-binding HxlR family transcriptional regulator
MAHRQLKRFRNCKVMEYSSEERAFDGGHTRHCKICYYDEFIMRGPIWKAVSVMRERELFALYTSYKCGPMAMRALALKINAAGVKFFHPTLFNMYKRGLFTRTKVGNKAHYSLTPRGLELAKAGRKRLARFLG